jgi:hypothetical protein
MGLYPIVFHYKDNSTVYPDPLYPTVYDVHLVLMFPSTLYMLGTYIFVSHVILKYIIWPYCPEETILLAVTEH